MARAPALLTAYLVWMNRGRGRRRRVLSVLLALCLAWTSAAWIYVHAHRAAAMATLAWVHRHDLFWATIAAIVSGVLVSRRRALQRMAASRAWTAALPVGRWPAMWQAIAVESVPALVLACVLAVALGSLCVIGPLNAGGAAPLATWAATTGGVVLGAAINYLVPSVRQEELYEGSRYVPHRRRAETPVPSGSLAALGVWPVRHLFASARPKTLARALIPILLAVPMQSTAAGVLLAIGLLTIIGALVLLVAAVISVGASASRWLKPLPLGRGLLSRTTLMPALAVMGGATAAGSWLLWVAGCSVARCIEIGVLALMVSGLLAVSGSVLSHARS